MFLRVERGSAVPISRQIEAQISTLCASGKLRTNQQLPSVRELARELSVNQNTVLRVYERLVSAGLLEMRHGQGTFVTSAASTKGRQSHRKRLVDEFRQLAQQGVSLGLPVDELHSLLDEAVGQIEKSNSSVREKSS